MPTNKHARLGPLLLVFALSGFAGLIYQSIWSHYLGLTLGHAAYAQTLVLAIYMGGLAFGSWLASRKLASLDNPVRTYAQVELAIGLLGLAFHAIFQAYTDLSQNTILPQLAGGGVHFYQWCSAAMLILPQCILLGMTFPLMAAGFLRVVPDQQAWSLGGLYFTNSFGAALGALVATFALLPWIGMPGAMLVAGIINVVVALVAWRMSRPVVVAAAAPLPKSKEVSAQEASGGISARNLLAVVLLAAAITGGTSFVYEIVWVRMLNLAFGTTLHSFELMLAAFILGLAAGAYWIHRRGDRSANTLRLAGVVQVLMGIAALGSAIVFSQSFHWVSWLVLHLPKTEAGYSLYNLGCALIALLVMFPAAFFAGATLPLFTTSLLRSGQGEKSVGRVYAANTLGAILGVVTVVHVLIPSIGLHLSLLLAAVMDAALGLALIRYFGGATLARDIRIAGLGTAAMLACAMLFGRTHPIVQVSGVFRTGNLQGPETVRLAYRSDGKTSTVSVLASVDGTEAAIATNGKPDAGLTLSLGSAPLADEVTMILAAALPLSLHQAPKDVAIIGWGSGLTTHTFLGSDRVRRLDTIEIEPAMHEGAKAFGSRVARAYQDPRSHVVFDDARTYFSAGRKRYDIIVSEPSNPWVSGVASLFTEEFYEFLRRHLNEGGIFVQWLQTYEISDALQANIVSAFLKKFPDGEAYLTNSSDMLLVASNGPLGQVDMSRLAGLPLTRELQRVGLVASPSFEIRRIGGGEILETYVRMLGATGHSDYYPTVALGAPKSRFLDEKADILAYLVTNGMPVLDLIDGRKPSRRSDLAVDNAGAFVGFEVFAGTIVDAFEDPAAMQALKMRAPTEAGHVKKLLALSGNRITQEQIPEWSASLAAIARYSVGALPSEDLSIWIQPDWLAPDQPAEVSAVMAAYRAAAERDAKAMREKATAVLASRGSGLSQRLREQMLVIAMAGAAGEHQFETVRELQAMYGPTLGEARDLEATRHFLLEWSNR